MVNCKHAGKHINEDYLFINQITDMGTGKFVTNTWILAAVFHPVVFIAYVTVFTQEHIGWDQIGILMLYGFYASLPLYGLCLFFIRWIKGFQISSIGKLFLWLAGIGVLMVAGLQLIDLLTLGNGELAILLMPFCIPGYVLAILASLVFYPQFVEATKITTYEDDFLSESE